MTSRIRRLSVRLTVSSVLVAGLVATLGAFQTVTGHDELPAHHKILPENATAVMRAFQEDVQPPQDLESLATTGCVGGFAGIYPCNNVDLEAFMPLAAIGGTAPNSAANDIWGWTDPDTGKEYAIVGRVFGTSFVDISDPANPSYLGNLPTHGAFGSSWRDIKVYANHAFIVSEAMNHGMQVFDLTQLRNVANPPVNFSETAHYKKVARAHNIAINEDTGYAYIVGASGKGSCNGGLHMVDISTPSRPASAGCYGDDGYTHDTQCVLYKEDDPTYPGQEICFNANEDTLTIVDVTDKSNPIQLSRTGYSGVGYTHQGWLTEDKTHFLLDDELDEQNSNHNTRTRVFDVSDLDAPSFVEFYESTNLAIDHNQYVKGNFAFQANYRSGLRVVDIRYASTASLSEVAFFDIYPGDDAAQFNGAWSNYPYFDSGIVIVSGIEQGLFVLRPNLGPVDNAPMVNVTDPAEGATVSGTGVLVAATASDDNGVTQVEFFVDGNSIGVDTTSPYSVTWDSTSVPDGSHVVSATATDTISQTTTSSNNVTVDNVPSADIHVGDLDGSSVLAGPGGKWSATVTVAVHGHSEGALSGAMVSGNWSGGANGSGSCVTVTNASGLCSIIKNNVKRNSASVTFNVSDVSHGTDSYASGKNHDPDGDSNGTTIVVLKP